MKNQNLLSLLLWLLIPLAGFSQSNIQQATSINSDGAAPHASALLDVSATDKGVLVPRMTTAQRMAIPSPAIGLMVFDTDLSCFCFYSGGAWSQIGSGYVAGAGISISGDTINNTGDLDAADDIISGTPAGGDLAGTYPNPTIPANAVGSMEISNGSIAADDLGQMSADTGQVMNWNGSAWTPGSISVLQDADGDTKVQVEESPDENIIRFDLGGTESMVLKNGSSDQARLEVLSGGNSTIIGLNAGQGGSSATSESTYIGVQAGNGSQYGNSNVCIGNRTGGSAYSTAIGVDALNGGISCTAIGYKALDLNTVGNENTAVGAWAMAQNTSGLYNVAIGVGAMYSSANAHENTAVGYKALNLNNSGNRNSAFGEYALYGNDDGWNNTAIGTYALSGTNHGNSNTAIGVEALASNESGYANVAIGAQALVSNTSRSNLVAVGDSSLYNNGIGATLATHATKNTAVGSKSLFANTTGSHNTAVGFQALKANTTGVGNNAFGSHALFSNTTGSANFAFGNHVLYLNTTGSGNTAMGGDALYNTSTGNENTAVGLSALVVNTTGNSNTAVGAGALGNNDSGNYNTAVGASAMTLSLAGATGNTALGYQAFTYHDGGNYVTCLGYQANITGGDINNVTALGKTAIANASNKVRIGNTAVTVIEGQVDWTFPSDARFKFNVHDDNVPGLAFIRQLRPVTYQFDRHKFDLHLTQNYPDSIRQDYLEGQGQDVATALVQTGFLAQEVEQVCKKLNYEFSGLHLPSNESDNYGLAYGSFVPLLVKGMQEQQVIIEAQQQKIQAQQAQLESQAAALQKITNALQTAGIQLEN